MSIVLRLCFSLVVLTLVPVLAHAATLEIPGSGTTLSGVGVISGWKCTTNGELTVSFDGGDAIPLLYGSERTDVHANGRCLENDHDNVGFVAIWNWGNLEAGEHTAVAYDNGVEFARSTFTVTTLGEEFVTGAVGECRMLDFPAPGESTVWEWNEATQGAEALLVEDFAPADQTAFDRRVVGKRAINASVRIDYVSAGRLKYNAGGDFSFPGAYSYEKTGPTTATLTVDYEGTSQGTQPHCVYHLTFTSTTTGLYHADPSSNCWDGWERDGWGDSQIPPPVPWELIDIGELPAPAGQAAFEARMAGKQLLFPGDAQISYVMSGGRYSQGYAGEPHTTENISETGTYEYYDSSWTVGLLFFDPDDEEEDHQIVLIFTTPTVGANKFGEEFHITDLP